MQVLKPAYYTVAFLLEIGMLIAFFMWGFRQGSTAALKYTFGIGVAALVIAFWGIFMAPKAAYRLGFTLKIAIEIVLFITATLMLYRMGYKTSAIIFGAATLFKEALSMVYKE